MKNGLVSVTFRKLGVDEILTLCRQADLKFIEWGSDVHVPETDIDNAKALYKKTKDASISVSSYGTYFKLGQNMEIEPYLKCAKALHTKILRIWAGTKGSGIVTYDERKELVKEAVEVCKKAEKEGLEIHFEYHPNTLTDNCESAVKLMEEINMKNAGLYWQPNYKLSLKENIKAFNMVKKYVKIVHIFFWNENSERFSLNCGKETISEFLKHIPKDTVKLLEFVPNDSAVVLPFEAGILRGCEGESGVFV